MPRIARGETAGGICLIISRGNMKMQVFDEKVEKNRELLSEPYIELYDEWVKYVNQPLKEGELENIRNSVNRQAPLGQEQWQREIWHVVYFEKKR